MKVFDFNALLSSREKADTDMIIAIGVFDGVHKGHRKIFETVSECARKNTGYESMCITFSTNPKNSHSGSLDTMRLREEYVSSFAINSFTIIDFSENFSKISASGFASEIMRLCRPRILVVGSDFKCGNPKESADGDGMVGLFASEGVDVELKKVDFVLSESGEKISSTLLRRLIKDGDLESYSRLSGQSYRVDLMTEPSRFDQDGLTICREHIRQLLPPPGAYEGTFVNIEGNEYPVMIDISDSLLSIHGRCSGQRDSLFITRRR